MALTTDTTLFGARGVTCPATLYKMVSIKRTVNFKTNNAKGGASDGNYVNYDLIPVPKGFMITHIAVEQTQAVDAGDRALLFKLKTAETQIGGTFTLDSTATDIIRQCDAAIVGSSTADMYASSASGSWTASDKMTIVNSAPASKFCSAADTLCMCVPYISSTSADNYIKDGEMIVYIIGYQVFGESLGDIASGTPAWTTGQSADDADNNKSGGDPMFRQPEYA